MDNCWKDGPLPPNTYGWGGIVRGNEAGGFEFADFCGDHVELVDGCVVKANDVCKYNNSLTLPPNAKSRAGK